MTNYFNGLYRMPVYTSIKADYDNKLRQKLEEFDGGDILTLNDYATEHPKESYRVYYILGWSYRIYFANSYTANNIIRWMYKNCPCLLDCDEVLEDVLYPEDMHGDEWIIL